GQRSDRGKSPQEPREVRDDRRYLGLLEHDLADPDRIGIASPPPRQVTRMAAKPRPKPLSKPATNCGIRQPDWQFFRLGHPVPSRVGLAPKLCSRAALQFRTSICLPPSTYHLPAPWPRLGRS